MANCCAEYLTLSISFGVYAFVLSHIFGQIHVLRVRVTTVLSSTGENANICPAGFYCVESSSAPNPCPEGSYSPNTGLTRESDCLNCTGGFYCNDTGTLHGCSHLLVHVKWQKLKLTASTGTCVVQLELLTGSTAETGPCGAGYYCPDGSRQADELECPLGHWCPVQTHYPQQCSNGTFLNTTGTKLACLNVSSDL